MKYYETDLQERYDWPNKYYAVRVWKGRDYGTVVYDHIYVIDEDAAIRHMPFLKRLTTIYTDVPLETDMLSMIYVQDPRYDEVRTVSALALPYGDLAKYGIPAADFDDLANGISLIPDNHDFYCGDAHEYKLYKILEGSKEIVRTVLAARGGNWLETEKEAMTNLDQLLNLPKAEELPEPLKSLVYDQFYCEYGMLFIENDEEFREHWSIEKVRELSEQVDKYNLNNYIEMPAKPKDAFEVPEGEPVITAYCGLSGNFNFIDVSVYFM